MLSMASSVLEFLNSKNTDCEWKWGGKHGKLADFMTWLMAEQTARGDAVKEMP